jgi:hypothetical protein
MRTVHGLELKRERLVDRRFRVPHSPAVVGGLFLAAAALGSALTVNHSASLIAASRTLHFSIAATKSKTLPCALQEKQ